jgi:hypothetical protein
MKIKVHMLRRDRTIKSFAVDSNKNHFYYNNGLYSLEIDAINVSTINGVVNTNPEIFFVEDNPIPISSVSKPKKTEETFLDEVVLNNAIRALAGEPSRALSLVLDYLRDPKKLILLAFALAILFAVIQGMIPH